MEVNQQEQPLLPKKLPQWLITVTPLSKVLAMILFIALPFLGFYLGMQYKQQVTVNTPVVQPSPIPTPDPTADWKTYTKTNAAGAIYSIKYPQSWSTGEDGEDIPPEYRSDDFGIVSGKKNPRGYEASISIDSGSSRASDKNANLFNMSFEEAKKEIISDGQDKRLFKINNIKIDNIDAVQYVQRTLPGDATEPYYSVITWLVHDDTKYYFKNPDPKLSYDTNYYFSFRSNESYVKNNLEVYNQILSTFKFN